MQSVDEYIRKAQHLVPAPHILPVLLPLLSSTESNNQKIGDLIAYDTSLTANVLRVCNSSYYCRGTPIDNLAQATTHLGSREIYRIVVAVTGALSLSANQKGYGVEAADLWRHSVTAGVAAQLVAKQVGEDEMVVFTAGILHDLGKIILSVAIEDIPEQYLKETAAGQSLFDIEERLLGCHHAEVGGRLIENWKFPPNLVAAVRYHHKPSAANPNYQRLAAAVYLGNFIAYFMGYGYGHHALSLKARDETLQILNLQATALPPLLDECFQKLQQVRTLYNLKS